MKEEDLFCAKCGEELTHQSDPSQKVTTPATAEDEVTEDTIRRITNRATAVGLLFTMLILGVFAYSLFLYSTYSTEGEVLLPFLNVTLKSNNKATSTVENDNEELMRQMLQNRASTPSSPYDQAMSLSSEYAVKVFFVPNDTSTGAQVLLKEYRTNILKMLKEIPFPAHLVNGRAIGLVSPAWEGGEVLFNRTTYDIPKGGAHGSTYSDGSIFLYGTALGDRFEATLAHELGHVLSHTFTSADWVEWARLRGEADARAVFGREWEMSAKEDFAEEFKRYVNNYQGEPNIWGNTTGWGESSFRDRMSNDILGSFGQKAPVAEPASKEVQNFIKKRLE